jgi:SAM-dependent methyltransferase
MATSDAVFAGSVPALYERYMVPLKFAAYAEDIAERLSDLRSARGRSLLEIAAGTGAVTRAIARALPNVGIVATDLNEEMVREGRSRCPASITWQVADAQALPFDDASFDAVVCQFGWMFLPDKRAGFREAHRVLKPGGKLVVSVWDRIDANPLSRIVTGALASEFPDDPPRFFERAPFGYHDPERIRADALAGGFAVTIERVEKVTQTTAETAAIALCQATPLRGEIESRGPLAELTDRARRALVDHFGDAPFENRMSALVVTATR